MMEGTFDCELKMILGRWFATGLDFCYPVMQDQQAQGVVMSKMLNLKGRVITIKKKKYVKIDLKAAVQKTTFEVFYDRQILKTI